jgi:hypothetical protein
VTLAAKEKRAIRWRRKMSAPSALTRESQLRA